jgi:hypothetical protein
MAILNSLKEGWQLFIDSISVLKKYPSFLIPIFIAWVIIAAVVLYLRYWFVIPDSLLLGFLEIFGFLFLITFIVTLSNLMMLELVQQIENGQKPNFGKALKETFTSDLIKAIPLAFLWAVIWFIILVIEALLSKAKRKASYTPSLQDAAEALGGVGQPISWLKLGLDMIQKVLRMTIFLSLPAIAWENMGPVAALKKGIQIIKKHPVQFLSAYTLTSVAAFFMAIPLIAVFYLDLYAGVVFPSEVWVIVIIYEGIVWTLSMYLEQMSVALLYIWHLRWENKGEKGDLSSVAKPNLLDDHFDLAANHY